MNHMNVPMSHHLKTASAYSVHDLRSLLAIRDLELLLKEDGRLLVGRLDDARNKKMIGRAGRGMKEGEEVDRL